MTRDSLLTLFIFLLALFLIVLGLGVEYSWSVACAALGGILLGVVVLSRVTLRRPVE